MVVVLGIVAVALNSGTESTAGGPASTTAPQVPAVPVTTMPTEPSAPPPPASLPAASTPVAPPGPAVAPAALAGLLASPADVGRIVANSDMTAQPLTDRPFLNYTVDPVQCTGALIPGGNTVYDGSGFSGFAGQVLADDAQNHKVVEAAASFATPDAARTFFGRQMDGWRGCKTTTVTLTIDDGKSRAISTATLGDLVDTDGTASILIIPSDSARTCEHAMALRNNVIVDVRVCSPNVGSMGRTLTGQIANKIAT